LANKARQVLLLSPPLSYPLPLLSLTSHLALLSTRLPRLKSEGDEDPLFDDDWDAAVHLYPPHGVRPTVTLLIMSVGPNIIFDPTREELAVADAVLAISVAGVDATPDEEGDEMVTDSSETKRSLKLVSIRTIDTPSRLTPPGVPDRLNTATGGAALESTAATVAALEGGKDKGVWTPPRGGVRRTVVKEMLRLTLEKGGVGEEVLDGLEGVELW
jgi:exosome complex component RRP42